VVTQVAKQYREQIAVALLVVAVVYIGCGLGLLFKGYDLVQVGFAEKSALDGYLFSHPVLVAVIAVAVLLVGVWGEPSPHARTLVLAAVGIGAVALVFAVITWIAAFSAEDGPFPAFVGVQGAGKVVGAFLVLAQIALLVLVLFFAGIALQALPRPVPAAAHWGAVYGQGGWAPGQDWQQPGPWQGQQMPPQQPGQPHPGQPSAPWAAPPSGGHWAPYGWQPGPSAHGAWGAPPAEGGWPQPAGWQHADHGAEPQAAPQEPETPPSNSDLYWRSAAEQAAVDEAAAPSHLAADAVVDAVSASDDEPSAGVGSWSHDAGPRAAELAGAEQADQLADQQADQVGRADQDQPAEGEEPVGEGRDDGNDTSGWWRPSAST
jgi:hypothetical protein